MMLLIDWESVLGELAYDPKSPLLFNNGFFLYFFTAFIAIYFMARNSVNVRAAVLSFFSLYFFYKASGIYVLLVILTAIIVYIIGIGLEKSSKKWQRKLLLAGSVLFNLGLLFYFKYTNFFIEIVNQLQHQSFPLLHLILPIGISFYTFENLSYTIDVYKNEIKAERNILHYLLFLSFFPKLVMGPIVRAKDFIPQLKQPYFVSRNDFYYGAYLICSGLFKKIIISDYITNNLVNYVFENPGLHTGYENLFAVYGYAIVIYCDFSGYSDVAIGIARWLGVTIPANFNSPYQSTSVTEFWKRWHISLSSWLQDYLYIFTLGGNRKGEVRTNINLMLTMLIGGFWHGANWTFIVWGALHGFALVVNKFWKKWLSNRFETSYIYAVIMGFITFHFVCLCWIFFKSADIDTGLQVINQIVFQSSFVGFSSFVQNYHITLWMILLAIVLHTIPDNTAWLFIQRSKSSIISIIMIVFFIALLFVYSYFKSSEPVLPIYLQF
jgi:D-alanyl-lipoteichoic acid acyltransferase DltB (MBOAT superfamily)